MRVAAVQLSSGVDKGANREAAAASVRSAADDGAQLVVLPELIDSVGSGEVLRASAEPLGGPFTMWACGLAAELGVWLHAGSFVELADDGRRFNTTVVASPIGEVAAVYRKIHLFDCDVPGAEFRDSATFSPGTEVVVYDGPDGVRVGCSLCYDVRFPELYRALGDRGARLVTVPAAFTAVTGPPHWEPLLRARAIENQVYVVAAGQTDAPGVSPAWHGHSMIVDPWGTVLGQVEDGPGVVVADVDVAAQDVIRTRLPTLRHRRLP